MGIGDRFKRLLKSSEKEKTIERQVETVEQTPRAERPKTYLSSGDILFVCASNTVISPIAAAIYNYKVSATKAFSAGLYPNYDPRPANVCEVCANHGITLFEASGIDDYILGEEVLILSSNCGVRDFLREKYTDFEVYTINEYAGFSDLDIKDPFGTDLEGHERCFGEIERAIGQIVGGDNSVHVKDFNQLNAMIQNGETEFVLDNDVYAGECIDLGVFGIVIDGNGHTLSGQSRVFHVTSSKVILKNITFANCHAVNDRVLTEASGGCLVNDGRLELINCNFINNSSSSEGGAIFNTEKGFLRIENCSFTNNSAKYSGGAIENNGELNVFESRFTNNQCGCGGAISNSKPQFTVGGGITKKFYSEHSIGTYAMIENCIFTNNDNAIYNDFYIKIYDSHFEDNSGEENILIHQDKEEAKLIIANTQISSNFAKIRIDDGFFKIESSKICTQNELIVNEAECEIRKLTSSSDGNVMYNNNVLRILKGDGFIDKVRQGENSQIRYLYDKLPADWRGLDYLNGLIGKGGEISLDCDITANPIEQDFYEGGIDLDVDGMVFDGNGHTIDVGKLTRIFHITAKDVVIKNTNFKAGKFFTNYLVDFDNGGGAIFISHTASAKFIGCNFMENESQLSGGVFCNYGQLELQKCIFENNSAKKYGGVCNNLNAISNIEGSEFLNNKTLGEGGVFNNRGLIDCSTSYFLDNYADGENNGGGGGVLKNSRVSPDEVVCKFTDCTFEKNSSRNEGGVVNIWGGNVTMTNCIFTDNHAWNGDVIYSRNYFVYIDVYNFVDCEFNNNSSTFDKFIDD